MWGKGKAKGGWGDDSGPYGGGGGGGAKGKAKALLKAALGGGGGFGGGDGGFGGGGWGAEGGKGGGFGAKGKGGFGKGGFGKGGGGGFLGLGAGVAEDDGYGGGGGGSKKKGGAGPAWDIEGFKEALNELFESPDVANDEMDPEGTKEKIHAACHKQSKKFYSDERVNEKMTGAQARAFIEEFVGEVMQSLSGFMYDKAYFLKVSWTPVVVPVVFHTFSHGKIFSRTVKADVGFSVESGILAWSEEERITKALWEAIENTGLPENQKKKANQHLTRAYDDAHYSAPYGDTSHDNPEVATLQDFVKGWMITFYKKSYQALESGLADGSPAGQTAAVTQIFNHLLDQNVLAIPLGLQHVVTWPAPWAFIETTAQEVIAECNST